MEEVSSSTAFANCTATDRQKKGTDRPILTVPQRSEVDFVIGVC